MSQPATRRRVRLLILTGSGRSGTRTAAGALQRLGLHIPQPEVPADETNPRGFYEPLWVVQFHQRLLRAVPVRTNDSRPHAAAEIHAHAAAPEVRAELAGWLSEQVDEVGPGGQLLVKDPRAFWLDRLWRDVADELGVDLAFLTMLRHPAEVVRSREAHYLGDRSEEYRRASQTSNLAGWLNTAYQTEVATRGRPRAFVRYVDLLADWRTALRRARTQLGLELDAGLDSTEPHEVDAFVDVELRRTQATWDGVDTIEDLRRQAVQAWEACNALVDAPFDETAVAALTDAHEQYRRLYQYAEAITRDHTVIAAARERRAVRRRLQERLDRRRDEVRRLRRELADVRRQGAAHRTRWRRA